MSWYEQVPKVELHIHLEGAIPLPTLWTLVQKYGGDPTVPTPEALAQKFQYADFPGFIRTWVWKNGFLREYDDFTLTAEAVARDMARQNIRYAEMFYSPPDFAARGLNPRNLTAAIRAGLARVPEIEIALVADLVRDNPPAQAMRTLSEIGEVREMGVVGVGLGGSEQKYPPEPFKDVFLEAKRLGFHTSAHAGEAAGAASIWGVIRHLQVDRIGHATRAHEDPALMKYLAERRIPLEMCPISNVRTGVVSSLEQHPIRRYFQQALNVTVNTDDPAMFATSLAQEYQTLVERLGFSQDDIRSMILLAISASWMPEERKKALIGSIISDPNWRQFRQGFFQQV